MKQSITVIIIFILLIFGYFQFLSPYIDKSETESVVSSGMKFYSEYEVTFLPIDSYFLYKEILQHPQIVPLPTTSPSENAYAANPFIRLLGKQNYLTDVDFVRSDNSYTINPKYKSSLVDPWDSILLKALYCDKTSYDDKDFSILQTLNHNDGSYWDTHFLLALLFLKNNGCYDSTKIENSIQKVSNTIIAKEAIDTSFSDLYAERIAVLYWAGYGKNIQKQWIEKIKDSLTTDPGWRIDNSYAYTDSNSHTTGLAILSLIYYIEAKPEQSFYQ
jgi:hypothetical protein